MGETRSWVKGHLDIILVPVGVLMLVAYHCRLLYRILKTPNTTFIGLNAINRRAWVNANMKEGMKNGVLAVQTLRNSIMASTLLAATAITLSSVLGILMGVGTSPGDWTMYGMKGSVASSVKCMVVLLCFLVAFICNAQFVRYYSHVGFLINTPPLAPELENDHRQYVCRAINRGAYFWSLGLRAFYFSLPLFLWNFGPIPMFVSTCVLLSFLHSFDTPSNDFNAIYNNCHPEEEEKDLGLVRSILQKQEEEENLRAVSSRRQYLRKENDGEP
ncbi:uncharacterized protein LOC131052815 [Cryptomeria japonica]|uniref:uncharacterized protein LOC131052815 n=1 Tax=Cryptomeria japonica TaxID=3369 RepID=UPI0025AB7424|nr:uncharacterized protein LOC131052815 [Cryptomeria japonica]